jgi:hypothetical protein
MKFSAGKYICLLDGWILFFISTYENEGIEKKIRALLLLGNIGYNERKEKLTTTK